MKKNISSLDVGQRLLHCLSTLRTSEDLFLQMLGNNF